MLSFIGVDRLTSLDVTFQVLIGIRLSQTKFMRQFGEVAVEPSSER